MYVNPVNPIIKKTLSEFLQKELSYGEQSYDFDDVVYQVAGDPDNERVLYSFKCNNSGLIFDNGGAEMLEQEYGQFSLPRDQWVPDWDLTLSVSTADFPKTQKVKRTMTDEEQEKIRQSNEEVRTLRQAKVDEIANKIAQFKTDFIGAPIRKALLAVQSGSQPAPCEIPYRKVEKYWITSNAPGSCSISFSFNFDNANDVSMVHIMLSEFKDSMRHVKGSVSVSHHDKSVPNELTQAFPHVARETYTNGIMQFTFNQIHLKKGVEQPMQFLAGFRQYITFHLQSMKQQLHKKMRARVDAFERVIVQARRDPKGIKNWKEQHVGIGETERELEEEKKSDEVFINTK